MFPFIFHHALQRQVMMMMMENGYRGRRSLQIEDGTGAMELALHLTPLSHFPDFPTCNAGGRSDPTCPDVVVRGEQGPPRQPAPIEGGQIVE